GHLHPRFLAIRPRGYESRDGSERSVWGCTGLDIGAVGQARNCADRPSIFPQRVWRTRDPPESGRKNPHRDEPPRARKVAGDSDSRGAASEVACVLPRSRRWKHARDRKSTRLNSSHVKSSYAVFCLKKKNLPTLCQRGAALQGRDRE